jgi:hypothetical protein
VVKRNKDMRHPMQRFLKSFTCNIVLLGCRVRLASNLCATLTIQSKGHSFSIYPIEDSSAIQIRTIEY